MQFNGKDVLIVGASGFLGSTLVERLASSGKRLHLLARHHTVKDRAHAKIITGSLDDVDLLKEILPHCGTIIHTASATTPGSSARSPVIEGESNILPTLRFLEMLQDFSNVHLIYLSSGGATYGNHANSPVNENQPLSPTSYHGAGKAAIEAFLNVRNRAGGQVTVLRPSNLYGPGQRFRPGFGIIRTMLEHAMRGTALEIWGDGENVRDFVYIDDMADVCMRFIDKKTDSGTYNVCSGESYTINQLCDVVRQACETDLNVTFKPRRDVDARVVALDGARLATKLRWKPKITLEDGIRLTWQWLKNQKN